jgi:hypothetical protein
LLTMVGWLASSVWRGGKVGAIDRTGRETWRMPPLAELAPAHMSRLEKVWMTVLRGYLVIAGGLVLFRIAQLALGRHG